MLDREELQEAIEEVLNSYPNVSDFIDSYYSIDEVVDCVTSKSIDTLNEKIEDTLSEYVDSQIPIYYDDMVEYIKKNRLFNEPIDGASDLASAMSTVIYNDMYNKILDELNDFIANLENIDLLDFEI